MRNILVRGAIRTLIVDDSATMRAMIARTIETNLDFEIVGIAASADAAEDLIETEEPDIVTLDHEMPGRTGLDLLRALSPEHRARVVMLSSHAQPGSDFVATCRSLGAKGCFDKAAIVREADRFVEVLRRAAKKPARASLSADIRVLHDLGLLGRRGGVLL